MHSFEIRAATADDIPAIFDIRTSVRDNAITLARLAEVGITPESVRSTLGTTRQGWIAADANDVVIAFAMVEVSDAKVLGLFTRPGFERRGCGSTLLDRAAKYLFDHGAATIWLTTGRDTPAADFYRRRGWRVAGEPFPRELRFELDRPAQNT